MKYKIRKADRKFQVKKKIKECYNIRERVVWMKHDDIEVKSLLSEFKQINNSVEVVSYEIGDQSESVPAVDGFWLKVTTKNHGWLHVYYNTETGHVEWY